MVVMAGGVKGRRKKGKTRVNERMKELRTAGRRRRWRIICVGGVSCFPRQIIKKIETKTTEKSEIEEKTENETEEFYLKPSLA